jgi:hypothetical protein
LPYAFTVKRPLLDLQTCAAITDLSRDRLVGLIEDGSIVAFNIAAPGTQRPFWRVLARSLFDHLAGKREAQTPAQLALEVSRLVPLAVHAVPLKAVYRLLACDQNHGRALVDAGLLVAITAARTGPNGSALITRKSTVGFLLSRMEGVYPAAASGLSPSGAPKLAAAPSTLAPGKRLATGLQEAARGIHAGSSEKGKAYG